MYSFMFHWTLECFQMNVPILSTFLVCIFHISIMQSVTPVLTAAARIITVMEEMLAINAESELCCTVTKVQSELLYPTNSINRVTELSFKSRGGKCLKVL